MPQSNQAAKRRRNSAQGGAARRNPGKPAPYGQALKGAGRTFREAVSSNHIPPPLQGWHPLGSLTQGSLRSPWAEFLRRFAAERIPANRLSEDRSALGLGAVVVETLKRIVGDSTDRSLIWTAQQRAAPKARHRLLRAGDEQLLSARVHRVARYGLHSLMGISGAARHLIISEACHRFDVRRVFPIA
jgi:hypothetical protein